MSTPPSAKSASAVPPTCAKPSSPPSPPPSNPLAHSPLPPAHNFPLALSPPPATPRILLLSLPKPPAIRQPHSRSPFPPPQSPPLPTPQQLPPIAERAASPYPQANSQPIPGPLPESAAPQGAPTYLATTSTGYLLLETDRGILTLNPRAARERIAYERLLSRQGGTISQPLLLPETVHLPPADSARIRSFLPELQSIGFAIEEFGRDVWKLDAVPTLAAGLSATDLLATIATDIAEAGAKRGSTRWRDELIARSVARSYAGANVKLTREGAIQLVEELMATRQPYICPRNKPTMILSSNTELARKFDI